MKERSKRRRTTCLILGCVFVLAAREYFEMALSMDPNDGRTLFKLANFFDASFEMDEAEENYLCSLECEKVPSSHRLCTKKEEKEECLQVCLFCLAGTYADFLLSGRHDVASATMCYEACLHLNPQHGEAAHNLAMVFKKKKKECVFVLKCLFEKVLAKKDPVRAAALLEVALKHQSDSSSYGRAGAKLLFCCFFFCLFSNISAKCCSFLRGDWQSRTSCSAVRNRLQIRVE